MKMTGKQTPEDALLVLKDYTEAPIVTMGQQGCIYYDNGVKSIPVAPHIKSVDTTGAGDNFVTGVIYGLLLEYSLRDCIRLGSIFAGYSTTKMGCYGARITKKIIDLLFN